MRPFNARLIAMVILFASPVFAEPIRVITHQSPGWADDNSRGFAPELVASIFQSDSMKVDFNVLPANRASRTFVNAVSGCYLGGSPDDFAAHFGVQTISSTAISSDRLKIYSLKAAEIITHDDIPGKQLAVGSGLEDVIPENLINNDQRIIVPNASNGFKMLTAGRVDGVIAFETAVTDIDMTNISETEWWLLEVQGFLNCKPNPEAVSLIAFFNSRLEEGLRTGVYNQLYKTYNKALPR